MMICGGVLNPAHAPTRNVATTGPEHAPTRHTATEPCVHELTGLATSGSRHHIVVSFDRTAIAAPFLHSLHSANYVNT
jgi:hypothetical protein